jgi:hypothetical protein
LHGRNEYVAKVVDKRIKTFFIARARGFRISCQVKKKTVFYTLCNQRILGNAVFVSYTNSDVILKKERKISSISVSRNFCGLRNPLFKVLICGFTGILFYKKTP